MRTTTGTAAQRSSRRAIRIALTIGAVAALLIAMALDTRFLTSDQAQAVTPAEFDAAVYARDAFPAIAEAVSENAHPIVEIVSAVAADPAAAGEEYGNVAGTDKYAIPVELTGTVSAVDADFLTVVVAGLPPEASVRVPLAQAINGTALRDVTGEIGFADFPGQTDYQQVANELKAIAMTEVVGPVDAAALAGTTIDVTGVYVTDSGPDGTFLVTPVSIRSAS